MIESLRDLVEFLLISLALPCVVMLAALDWKWPVIAWVCVWMVYLVTTPKVKT